MMPLIITAVIAVVLAFLAFQKNRQLKTKAKECSKEAQRFHEKLQQLTAPDHFFTDEELHQLKIEFAPLLREVNKLYDSIFISREYLDNLGLYDFIEERKLLNHQQFQNNQKFQNK